MAHMTVQAERSTHLTHTHTNITGSDGTRKNNKNKFKYVLILTPISFGNNIYLIHYKRMHILHRLNKCSLIYLNHRFTTIWAERNHLHRTMKNMRLPNSHHIQRY